MSFLSYPFLWLFLPLGLILYWLVPRRARLGVLLALNAVFYAWQSPWQIVLLLVSILITYFGARTVDAHRDTPAAKRWLALTLTANFSMLLAFKLQPLLLSAAGPLLSGLGLAAPEPSYAVLPMGLSFFIFAGSGYVIDVYWQRLPVQKNFWRHAAFVSFFPTISAGPILRAGNWYPQLEALPRLTLRRLKRRCWSFFGAPF